MELKDIKAIERDLTLVAFYLGENDNYVVDMTNLEPTELKLDEYLTTFDQYSKENAEDHSRGYTEHKFVEFREVAVTYIKQARDQFKILKDGLAELKIPAKEFTAYLQRSVVGPNIAKYQELKNVFHHTALTLYHLSYQENYLGNSIPDYTQPQNTTKRTTTILNHNNPFADITIQNQEFLYPDSDGLFQTLRFNVGYTLTKVESEDSNALVLQPGFKIAKGSDRDQVNNSVAMDDTITTPIPASKGELNLLYI